MLPPVSTGYEPALELNSGLQKCIISETAGTGPAGGTRLDLSLYMPDLCNVAVAVACVFLISLAVELR